MSFKVKALSPENTLESALSMRSFNRAMPWSMVFWKLSSSKETIFWMVSRFSFSSG